ncbi:CoA transferase subunit A [Paenibacillus agricola]|uniref:CoA transferase subunit A n=1 Tax=Paenibacillus agricola TaxID=2716264 RepID=A0ABX0J201_9BACL|nr:CoA transferase subunit A [Paenibacillus agricola]NHN29149.1 CoA transferase subunit A [Paenibacillus agricola]
MPSKFLTLTEAIDLIENGMTLAVSGNMEMSPMALIREVIRAKKISLSLVCVGAAAINADLLLGANCVRTIEFSQISLGEFGFAPHFRRRFEQENDSVTGLEHACPSLIAAITAGAMGIPFIPVRGLIGTDYMSIRPDFKQLTNPYNAEEQIAIVPAIRPDVAIFHAYQADTEGNVLAHPSQNNRVLAQASERTIVSVEQIVSPEELKKAEGSRIPAAFVTAVVHVPFGAHPTSCPGIYKIDNTHIRHYLEASKSETGFEDYLHRYVTAPKDHEAYLFDAYFREIKR